MATIGQGREEPVMAGGKTFKRDQKRRKEMERKLRQEEKMRKKAERREAKKAEGGGEGGEETLPTDDPNTPTNF
jgi:hypothetical protein